MQNRFGSVCANAASISERVLMPSWEPGGNLLAYERQLQLRGAIATQALSLVVESAAQRITGENIRSKLARTTLRMASVGLDVISFRNLQKYNSFKPAASSEDTIVKWYAMDTQREPVVEPVARRHMTAEEIRAAFPELSIQEVLSSHPEIRYSLKPELRAKLKEQLGTRL